jgi:energy-coupling factor transporter transmembrane protein EcfT
VEITLFRYKKGSSLIHRANARAKLAALLLLSFAAAFVIPVTRLELLCAVLLAVACFSRACGFGFIEQINEARPFAFYFAVLYVLQAVSAALGARDVDGLLAALVPGEAFITALFRIAFAAQFSLLFYKTTTGAELREALSFMPGFSRVFSVFLSCVPDVLEAWNRAERAWKARHGKNGVQKIILLMPAFFSACFYAASQKARALAARETVFFSSAK